MQTIGWLALVFAGDGQPSGLRLSSRPYRAVIPSGDETVTAVIVALLSLSAVVLFPVVGITLNGTSSVL